jgi:hypothetical protein
MERDRRLTGRRATAGRLLSRSHHEEPVRAKLVTSGAPGTTAPMNMQVKCELRR